MKIVVFGAGEFYQKRKKYLLEYTDIQLIAIIDNNKSIHGIHLDGIPVFAVEQILTMDFDVILLMSIKTNEMKNQLLNLGIDIKKIWCWARLKSEKERGKFSFYCGNTNEFVTGKKVLIISTNLGYNGGSLAAVYAARALEKLEYNVVLAAPEGNPAFINEMKDNGLNIIICLALPYLYQEEILFIKQFDYIIVNVFQMILCASEISKIKPVLWWIHEPSSFYEPILIQFDEYIMTEKLEGINIYAVSKIAQRSFNQYFPNRITKTLAYGIPDEREAIIRKKRNKKIVFAIIGGVIPLKAQDIFLKAVKRLESQFKNNALFLIIGLIGQDPYSNEVKRLASLESSVLLMGEMTRDELKKVYLEIDVLVCSSLEETLSIVTTEAMMHGKACIVSDTTGIADYIHDGINGLVFKSGNVDELADKMRWIFNNEKDISQIGRNARQTYEKYFKIDDFGKRLEKALLEKY